MPPMSRPTLSLCHDLDFAPLPSNDPASFQQGSPSSVMTVRGPDASARDADPFSTLHPSHTRSSRVSRWLSELHSSTASDLLDLFDVDVRPTGTQCNPYLAYPHMAAVRRTVDDADSMHDYVVVDPDIALECPPDVPRCNHPPHDSAPPDISSPRSTVPPPQSLRHFHLPISPRTTLSPSPSKSSMFHHQSRADPTSGASGSYHARSTSLQAPQNATLSSGFPRASSWRWRPSVLGHFSSTSIPDTVARLSPRDSLTDQSRPSMCSSNTCSSITTPTTMSVRNDGGSPVPSTPPSKTSSLFGSLRIVSHRATASQPFFKSDCGSASSPSLHPMYPTSAPHLPDRRTAPPSPPKATMARLSFASKSRQTQSGGLNQNLIEEPDDSQPHVLYASKSGGPRLSLSLPSPTRQAKKKTLVVSGIALNDTRRLDAIQRWCQSFGEIDQITRVPNGNLHISFQKAEVADTVCRVRARVHIAGVGSVHLSWITGNKRR